MSLIQVASTMFKETFEHEYAQQVRKLQGAIMEIRGITGEAYKCPISSAVVLHDRGAYHSAIAPTIPTNTQTILTPSDKIALIPSDIFEQAEVNVSEVKEYSIRLSESICRWEDQFVLDALNASTTSQSVAVGTTNLTIAKVAAAAKYLDLNNVPDADRHFVGHASQKWSLLQTTEVSSSDYNTVRALSMGQIDSYMGFQFHWFGDMDEGGVYKTGDNRTNFAFHKNAVLLGYWINPTVSVDWEPSKQSHIIVPKIKAGAIEQLPKGIVKIVCDETK